MKTFKFLTLFITLFFLTGCDFKNESGTNAESQQTNEFSKAAGNEIVGDFRLIKVMGSDGVFVLKDGKVSPIADWSWVKKNASNKDIETVPESELTSYPGSGIVYK